jgi:hypothetical protein
MAEIGESLNNHKTLTDLSHKDRGRLREMLKEITIPYKLIGIYWDGSEHVAWIEPERHLKVQKIKPKKVIRSK